VESAVLSVQRTGFCEFDAIVEDSLTGKKKRPADAAGSNIYSAVVEVGQPAPPRDTFRFGGFSPNCHHPVRFAEEHVGQQGWLFARYTNSQGTEGPDGPVAPVIIG
jgi:hypothetical protein